MSLEPALTRLLRRELNAPDAGIEALQQMSGGASREIWSFRVVLPGGMRKSLILRLDPPSARAGLMRIEAAAMAAARAEGVPVPDVLAGCFDPSMLGACALVMERVEGEALPRRILSDPGFEQARLGLAAECGRILAGIHRARVGPGVALDSTDPLHYYRAVLDRLGTSRPAFELAFAWLERNRPPATPGGPVLLHGDFRLGNFLVAGDRISAVLDWEMAKMGDPMEDLAWLCLRAWRFGGPLPVGGFGRQADLIGAYEEAGGPKLNSASLRWWEVLSTLKWGVICLEQASLHILGAERSVELAMLGRRACETEWDLLHLLYPPPAGLGQDSVGSTSSGIQGESSAPVLAGAARGAIMEIILPALAGKARHHARIVARVIGILAREAELAPAHAAAADRLLSGLGVKSESDVNRLIRSGAADRRAAPVVEFAWHAARMRLSVAHPEYLAAGPG